MLTNSAESYLLRLLHKIYMGKEFYVWPFPNDVERTIHTLRELRRVILMSCAKGARVVAGLSKIICHRRSLSLVPVAVTYRDLS